MEFKTAQTKIKSLSGRLHYILLISIGLLISNIFLVWLVGWSFVHQKQTVVPAVINQPFTISDVSVDASYLRQMSLFFVAERLNISPSNIEHNHRIILQYTDPKFYHEFTSILNKERQVIAKQNISSAFYPYEVIPNIDEMNVLIRGFLNHWVGNSALSPIKKNYLMKFSYTSGNLKIYSFSEITEEELERKIKE